MGEIDIVVGGQFGSEGKGAVGARIGSNYTAGDALVRVAGPNAGHTAYDSSGNQFAFRQLPVATVTSPDALIVIGAGSEIDMSVLVDEIATAERHGHRVMDRLMVDGSATVLTEADKVAEGAAGLVGRIGSTGKGVGAARAQRVMRTAPIFSDVAAGWGLDDKIADTAAALNRTLERGYRVMIEGTQGYGLGVHTPFYPKTTSSDCRAIDFLSMAGVNPFSHFVTVWVVLRVYPIRVAGDSGPLLGETTWEELGLPAEKTTVTHKIRRVGAWDPGLARDAVAANGGTNVVKIALTMVDQEFPSVKGLYGQISHFTGMAKVLDFVQDVELQTGARVALIGTGPSTMMTR